MIRFLSVAAAKSHAYYPTWQVTHGFDFFLGAGSVADIVAISEWGFRLYELSKLSDSELARFDIAALSLRCADGLPGTENIDFGTCLQKVEDWTELVRRATDRWMLRLPTSPPGCQDSEAKNRILVLTSVLQRDIGITYNFRFAEGDYDGSDSRNLFVHGPLTGFGGTCASLPVLFAAIGRRLGYPLKIVKAGEHLFCRWDAPDGERFNFDAAGRGFSARDDDYYRHWPRDLTETEIHKNRLLESMSPREELALFAGARANCFFENFEFRFAVEAYRWAALLAPSTGYWQGSWATATLVRDIWNAIQKDRGGKLPQFPLEETIELALGRLSREWHPGFIRDAKENLDRITRNHHKRKQQAAHLAAFNDYIAPKFQEQAKCSIPRLAVS